MSARVYLDWNATAPVRPEAQTAMIVAMDVDGNPSSVHAEGRAVRVMVERARAQVAALVGAEPHQVIFTSGATEANALALNGVARALWAATEHDSVASAAYFGAQADRELAVDADGLVDRVALSRMRPSKRKPDGDRVLAVAAANSETGVMDDVASLFAEGEARGVLGHCDATQAAGRCAFSLRESRAATVAISAHKLGGPKGVGALVHDDRREPKALIRGGGQESGWRAGTENVIGIVGFGAAAEAALRDLETGLWERVERLRDRLEARVADASPETIFVGAAAPRLPNTSCFATPGWRGETQVMALDLAGFAVSSGSACSSGKVGPSRALRAMGLDEATAGGAIRVSLGPTTTEDDIDRFAETWAGLYARRRQRAA